MANPHKLLQKTQQAIEFFQAGRLDESKRLLEDVCNKKVQLDVAYFLLATIHFKLSDYKKAIHYFQQTIRMNPRHHEACNNLGVAYERLGDLDSASSNYLKAIALVPHYVSAHFHLGNLLQQQKRLDDARQHYESVLSQDQNHLKALVNLALIEQEQSNLSRAETLLRKVLAIDPDDIEALNNLGMVCRALGKTEEAFSLFQRGVSVQENCADAHNNLGISYRDNKQYDLALAEFKLAVSLNPMNASMLTNLGLAYEDIGEREQAVTCYRKALSIDNTFAEAWNALGAAQKRLGREAEASESFQKATEVNPAFLDAKYNLAISQLSSSQFTEGWKNYFARPSRLAITYPASSRQLATDLNGKRILIEKDQGLGDELFFLRFAAQLKMRGAWIAYRPNPKIRFLVEKISAIDYVVSPEEHVDDIDEIVCVGDLPYLLGMQDNETPPATLEFTADETLVEQIKLSLSQFGPPPYIGITWRGGTKGKRLLHKEIPLTELARTVGGISGTIVVLQRLPAAGEICQMEELSGKTLLDMSELNEDLPAMLALLDNLDQYVGVSNTNMHLRAGLGRWAHVLVPHPAEFRWMASGKASPWFPDFRLHRQDTDGSWERALEELGLALKTA